MDLRLISNYSIYTSNAHVCVVTEYNIMMKTELKIKSADVCFARTFMENVIYIVKKEYLLFQCFS